MAENKKLINTTGTQYISTTISNPNAKSIIHSLASILRNQIIEDEDEDREVDKNSDIFFFSEEKYIEQKPEEFDEERIELLKQVPSSNNIYEFIKALYDCAQFSIECCIMSLVYINRMIHYTNIPLLPTNWRPLIFCALLIAQKIWDDKFITNADFAWIYPFFVTDEVNALESKFLQLVNYKVTVSSELYTKYYFELRTLFQQNSKSEEFPTSPLDKDQANIIAAKSGSYEKKHYGKDLSKTSGYAPKKGVPAQI